MTDLVSGIDADPKIMHSQDSNCSTFTGLLFSGQPLILIQGTWDDHVAVPIFEGAVSILNGMSR